MATPAAPAEQQVAVAAPAPVAAAAPQVMPRVIKVHPIVVFSVLDHHTRRQEGQERVIGTLLGTNNGKGVIEVTNAFAVPHTEKEDAGTGESEVAVGQSFNKSMFNLLSRVNQQEKIVGWYATSQGTAINDSSSLIHEFYTSECENAIHLVVDTSLGTKGVEIRAFYSVRMALGGTELARAFAPVKCELVFSDAEKLCLDRMIKGQQPAPFESPDALAKLPTEMESSQASVARLLDLLESTLAYVDEVVAGTRKTDPQVARHIADALSSLPKLHPDARANAFTANMNDVVMVSYLASITKTQLAIAAKIHQSF